MNDAGADVIADAGAAFAAVDGDVAMIQAIEVFTHLRRQGAARLLIELAARFALEQGERPSSN